MKFKLIDNSTGEAIPKEKGKMVVMNQDVPSYTLLIDQNGRWIYKSC